MATNSEGCLISCKYFELAWQWVFWKASNKEWDSAIFEQAQFGAVWRMSSLLYLSALAQESSTRSCLFGVEIGHRIAVSVWSYFS